MAIEKAITKPVVLDSSVILKWFCVEEDTDVALQLREDHIICKKELLISDLSLYEVANALRYKKTVTPEEVQEAVESILKLGIRVFTPTKDIMNQAIAYAFAFGITVYDAYFIALARTLDAGCITADKRLFQKVTSLLFVHFLQNETETKK